jgi:hypothetical protein
MRFLLIFLLVTATGALAIAPGGKLYIKSKDTLLLKEPKAKSSTVLTLQPGTEVTWVGASEKDNQFHQVEVSGKKGFVRTVDLSPHKPQLELDSSSGKPVSQPAFASSGGATKGPFGPGSIPYYKGSVAGEEAAAALIYLEALNEQKATPQAVSAKSKELHGPQ